MNSNKILIANTGEDSLTLIDLINGFETKTIFLSKLVNEKQIKSLVECNQLGPFDMEKCEDGYICITNSYDNSVMKIDIHDIRLLQYIKVGKNPTSIKRFGNKIYVANTDSNSISVIDEKSFTLIEDIPVGEKPTDIQIDSEGYRLFVANENCYVINVLDFNNELMTSINLCSQPTKVIIDEKNIFILTLVNNCISNSSSLLEINKTNFEIKMLTNLKGIFNNFTKIKGNKLFYLSNIEDGNIYRIFFDKDTNITKIYLGGMPSFIKWDGGTNLYISNIINNEVCIIDISTDKIIKKLRVGKEPNGILLL